MAWAALSIGCGAREPLDDAGAATGESPGEPEASADPCAVHTTSIPCCKAGCQVAYVTEGPGIAACLSEERDCARHPEVCTSDETCLVRSGGCFYGYGEVSVGECVPR
jgi:hypothetical protein